MGQYTDTYPGVVIDNADPEGAGRVLVQVPQVATDSAWARPEQAGAATPAVGTEVSVRYENGDEAYPLWSAAGAAAGSGHYSGTYRGVVLNNADPEGLGRLQVQVPDVPGADAGWATPENPPPQIGADVWVRFVDGDPQHPVWTA